jgi:hypothetical protein
MSAIAALAGFNGKGTQGLVATETPTGDDRSSFWNENDTTKTLLYGSTFTKCAESADTPNMGSKTWILDSGIDVLGDIGLEMEVYGGDTSRKFNSLFNIIDRIDFKVGSTIWQRLDGKSLIDIIGSKTESSGMGTFSAGDAPYTTTLYPAGGGVVSYVKHVFLLHLLTQGLSMYTPLPSSMVTETGHFVCASPDQQVSVTIYFKDWKNLNEDDDSTKISNIKTSLYYKHYILSNFERQKITNSVIPKRLNSTQSRMFNDLTSSPNSTIVLDVSEFSLYSSNLLLSLNDQPDSQGRAVDSYGTYIAFDFELLLNNTSVFGVISSEALNVFGQNFSKRTNIDGYSAMDHWEVYVIPLASCYNSASYVPLNRFDSIQIKLYIKNERGLQNVTATAAFDARVTCEGQVTALYDKGLASIRNS